MPLKIKITVIRNNTDTTDGGSPKKFIVLYKKSLNAPVAPLDFSILPMLSNKGNNINIPKPSRSEAKVLKRKMKYIFAPK